MGEVMDTASFSYLASCFRCGIWILWCIYLYFCLSIGNIFFIGSNLDFFKCGRLNCYSCCNIVTVGKQPARRSCILWSCNRPCSSIFNLILTKRVTNFTWIHKICVQMEIFLAMEQSKTEQLLLNQSRQNNPQTLSHFR